MAADGQTLLAGHRRFPTRLRLSDMINHRPLTG
jgi:hypothetical protein